MVALKRESAKNQYFNFFFSWVKNDTKPSSHQWKEYESNVLYRANENAIYADLNQRRAEPDSLKNRYILRNLKSTKTQRDQVDSVVSDIFADVITRYQLLKGKRFLNGKKT